MSDFSEWLVREMDRRRLSLREVGAATGVGHTTVKNWQTGSSRPTYGNCRKLAEALGVDINFVRKLAGYVDDPYAGMPDEPLPRWIIEAWTELDQAGRDALEVAVSALMAAQRSRATVT